MTLLGIFILIFGVILLVIGLNTSQTLKDRVVEKFTGQFSDRTIRYLSIGIFLMVLGAALIFFGLPK